MSRVLALLLVMSSSGCGERASPADDEVSSTSDGTASSTTSTTATTSSSSSSSSDTGTADPSTTDASTSDAASSSESASTTAPQSGTGLDFPPNHMAGSDARLVWSGADMLPRSSHTAIWQARYVQQNGYYAV